MTYISVDVETTGLIPGYNSLLSVGAVDCDNLENKFHVVLSSTDAYSSRLVWDRGTKDWWNSQEAAKERLNGQFLGLDNQFTYNQMHKIAAGEFLKWLVQFEDTRFFVAWPASFDYPYIQHLFLNEGIESPFSYRTIDVKSYACGKFNLPFDAGHDDFPEWLNAKPEFPHDALSDAIQQAIVFNKLREM